MFRIPNSEIRIALAAALVFVSGGCSSWPRGWGRTPCCIEGKAEVKTQPIAWHLFDVTVLEPVEQPFHPVRFTRKLFGIPVKSANLEDEQVRDSTFFTDRDPASLTPEAVRLGPTRPEDAVQTPVTITKAKTEGKTAGFFVKDAAGRTFLFKLDPVDAPGLLSGAEAVTSKLLYALGYHVPSYEVVDLPVEAFQPGEAIGAEALRALLEPRTRDGRVRVAASRFLEGEILGPAEFKKFRDCADVRALKVAYAWVNNIDTKDHNSLLVWDGQRTVGYLIDFGTSLGADAGRGGPKHPCAGVLNIVDMQEASKKVLTLGLHDPACTAQPAGPVSPAVGFFAAEFDPAAWKPYAPNIAFADLTDDDAEWIAARMARLSRAQIEAAVAAGRYDDPADAAYLLEALERRRQRIITTYLDADIDEEAIAGE